MAPKTVTRHRVSTPHHPWTMGGSRYHRQRRRCTHPRAYPRTYQHPTSDSFPLDACPFVVSAVAIWTPIQRMHTRPYHRPSWWSGERALTRHATPRLFLEPLRCLSIRTCMHIQYEPILLLHLESFLDATRTEQSCPLLSIDIVPSLVLPPPNVHIKY